MIKCEASRLRAVAELKNEINEQCLCVVVRSGLGLFLKLLFIAQFPLSFLYKNAEKL